MSEPVCPVHPKVKLDLLMKGEGSCFKCHLRYDLKEARQILEFCQRNGFKAKQKLVRDTGPLSFITWGLPPGGLKRKEMVIVHQDGSELTDKEIQFFSRPKARANFPKLAH